MKTTIIVLIVIAFLWVCVSLARDNRDAKKLPEVTKGLTYTVTKDKFEVGVNRYEIGVELGGVSTTLNVTDLERDVKEISEWIKRNRSQSEVFIIFFYVPGQTGAWGRVDYPNYRFELMPKLEY